MFRRLDQQAALEPGQGRLLLAAFALVALGLVPSARDPVAFLAWATLLAPALGGLLGAALVPLLWGATVPAGLAFGILWSDLLSPTDLPTPLWAALFVSGLFLAAQALGRLFPGQGVLLAGLALFAGLVCTGLSVQFGLAGQGGSWAASHPGLAAFLLELSPLVWAYDCAGLDWTHGQPDMYRFSGVEWFGRRAWRGTLAGPFSIVVGCTLFLLLRLIRNAVPVRGEPVEDPKRHTPL